MSGNLGDIGSIPEVVAQEMVEEIIKRKNHAFLATLHGVTIEDCLVFVREADEDSLSGNDLSLGEIEGLANLLLARIQGR